MNLNPQIGTRWVNKTFNNEIITIVESSQISSQTKKNIMFINDNGNVGGCNCKEWFYSEWEPLKRTFEQFNSDNMDIEGPPPLKRSCNFETKDEQLPLNEHK